MNHPLVFREDATFTIIQFTDQHFHGAGHYDQCTQALMAAVLDAERPDLVVLTGDVIDGSLCEDPASAWRAAVEPIESRVIPWAAVFGNHDDEGSLDRQELMAVQRSCRMCLSESGPAELPGVGNFVLTVRSSRGHVPAASLCFIDSGSYAADGDGYACVAPPQIDWLCGVLRTRPRAVPVLVFLHIPLPEFETVWDADRCRGSKHESVNCPAHNSGLFDALRAAGRVLGIFAGHDHLNDYEGARSGIRLCYGRATGYGSYGRDGFARGARVIRIDEGRRDFDTWLRLDDGTIASAPVAPRDA